MANDTVIAVIGNLTADPELRYTQNGLAVANFTIASTPRVFDKQKNEWVDGEALFLRASVWREFAEHVASSLTKGSRVIAQGRLKQRSYEDKEGNKRTSIELEIEEIGPSLRYATAQLTRTTGQNGQRGQQGGGFGGGQQGGFGAQQGGGFGGGQQQQWAQSGPPADEPWGQPQQNRQQQAAPQGGGQPGGGQQSWATPGSSDFDEPPF